VPADKLAGAPIIMFRSMFISVSGGCGDAGVFEGLYLGLPTPGQTSTPPLVRQPSTPDEVREAVIERAENGESVSLDDVKRMIELEVYELKDNFPKLGKSDLDLSSLYLLAARFVQRLAQLAELVFGAFSEFWHNCAKCWKQRARSSSGRMWRSREGTRSPPWRTFSAKALGLSSGWTQEEREVAEMDRPAFAVWAVSDF
jgi:hypothetical protein